MRSRRWVAIAPLGVFLALLLIAPAGASKLPVPIVAHVTGGGGGGEGSDDDVVLPTRVSSAIRRAMNLLDGAGACVDRGSSVKAVPSLKALQQALLRADKAARKQMNAPADPDAEEGATTGPESVIAVLSLDQTIITTLAGLFETKSSQIVAAAGRTLSAAMNARDKLLGAVIKLPAEGAGADYADGMADTLSGYDDEVANLTEALSDDTLFAAAKNVLRAALAKSKKTQSAINAAFGGGE